MKKPEKIDACGWDDFDIKVYAADEMDAYVEWLEKGLSEASAILKFDMFEFPFATELEHKHEWLEKYASEKVEGGNDENKSK